MTAKKQSTKEWMLATPALRKNMDTHGPTSSRTVETGKRIKGW